MRNWLSVAAAAAVMAVGCNKSPEGGTTPGSPDGFKIVAPTMSTSIKQGNKETVKLSIDRKDGFKRDVKLKVDAPDKIAATLNRTEIKASEPTEFTLDVAPAKDAPLGDHVIKVTGTPEGGGNPTSVDVKINVDKNP
jgi:hypothetical protein